MGELVSRLKQKQVALFEALGGKPVDQAFVNALGMRSDVAQIVRALGIDLSKDGEHDLFLGSEMLVVGGRQVQGKAETPFAGVAHTLKVQNGEPVLHALVKFAWDDGEVQEMTLYKDSLLRWEARRFKRESGGGAIDDLHRYASLIMSETTGETLQTRIESLGQEAELADLIAGMNLNSRKPDVHAIGFDKFITSDGDRLLLIGGNRLTIKGPGQNLFLGVLTDVLIQNKERYKITYVKVFGYEQKFKDGQPKGEPTLSSMEIPIRKIRASYKFIDSSKAR